MAVMLRAEPWKIAAKIPGPSFNFLESCRDARY